MPREFDPIPVLERLSDADVDFVVVGDVVRAAHGSGYPTHDLEVACALEPENERRLRSVVRDDSEGLRLVDVARYENLRRDAESIDVNGRSVRIASLDHLIARSPSRAGTNVLIPEPTA